MALSLLETYRSTGSRFPRGHLLGQQDWVRISATRVGDSEGLARYNPGTSTSDTIAIIGRIDSAVVTRAD